MLMDSYSKLKSGQNKISRIFGIGAGIVILADWTYVYLHNIFSLLFGAEFCQPR